MARPGRLELPTLCLEGLGSKIPSAFVCNRLRALSPLVRSLGRVIWVTSLTFRLLRSWISRVWLYEHPPGPVERMNLTSQAV